MLEISPQLLGQAKLSVNDMVTYLTQHGWDKVPNQNQRVMIFQGANDDFGNPIILTLPSNDGFGDALRRLSEAVNLVAFLAWAAEAPHPICTQMDVGMNASELTITCPMMPTSKALGRLGKYEETSKSVIFMIN